MRWCCHLSFCRRTPSRTHYRYHALTDEEPVAILKKLPKRPLLVGEKGVRLSLAGAQDKIAVRVDGDHVSHPLDGAPSTHILKPTIERFDGVVFNETLSMKLAAAVGLPTAPLEFRTVDSITFLLVERYDRVHRPGSDEEFPVEWVHQEDFCQALGIDPETKSRRKVAHRSGTVSTCFGRSQALRSSTSHACSMP